MKGKNRNHQQMHAFRQAVDSIKLFDLGFTDPSFTWSNGQLGQEWVMKRLDRIFFNSAWKLIFSTGEVSHGISSYSDHLLLYVAWNPKPHGTRCAEHIFYLNPYGQKKRNTGSWWSRCGTDRL